MKLLDEIISDYPRVWEYYKHATSEKSRAPKFSQRYPLPVGTLSMMLDFHKWTHKTSRLVADTTQLELPNDIRKTEVGPCPLVLYRLNWLNSNWSHIQRKQKPLSETLSGEITLWHTRIKIKVNDGDTYTYESSMVCKRCTHRSVMRINDIYICVNSACRNPITNEVLSWEIN